MKVVLIGVGQAGGKLAQAIAEFDYEMDFGAVTGALAVNTARADLQSLDIETQLIGQDRVKGHGVGGDNELGAEVMDADADQVMDALDGRITSQSDAIVLVGGLGGGTGSGGIPVLARELKTVYDRPVYALGILPGRDEGSLYQVNAGRSLKTVLREADSTVLIDNDAWRSSDESLQGGFETINRRVARRIGLLLATGERIGEETAETVVDASDLINTLRRGELAAVGYATCEASEDAGENINAITSLARNAVLTGTSLPDAVDAQSALLVVAGEPQRIARKGVERARKWVEEETGSLDVRGGDFPMESDKLAAIVVLGGIERSRRVEEFLDRAREASQQTDSSPADLTESFQDDRLDDLF
ncbi:MAG: tubulin/FtsZ family protein [Halococcoides sp.]